MKVVKIIRKINKGKDPVKVGHKPKNSSRVRNGSKSMSKSSKSRSLSLSRSLSESVRDRFMYYPEIRDEDFYERIYTKKEFHNYMMKDGEGDGGPKIDPCNPKEFIPKPHQQFLRNFISPDTPYNGILLVHGTGSGKTCTAISIAENFKEIIKKMGKKIIVITTLPQNFKKELYNERKEMMKQSPEDIVQCTGKEYEITGTESKYLTFEQKRKDVTKKINTYYEFFGYKEFANYISKNTNYWKGDEESMTEGIQNFISKNFDDTILIIDEVQNIKTDVSSDLKKSIQPILKSIIKHSQNLKLILMSATPMFDRQDEIIYLMNLLLLNDGKPEINKEDIFNRDQTLKPEAEARLRKIFKGYVSYIRGENPDSFPMKFFPSSAITDPRIEYNMSNQKINGPNKLKYTPIVTCPMKGTQLMTYVHQLEKLRKEGKIRGPEDEMNTNDNSSLSTSTSDDKSDFANNSNQESSSSSSGSGSKSKSSKESADAVMSGDATGSEMEDKGGMSIYRDLLNISNITFPVEGSEIGTFDKRAYREVDDGQGAFYKVHKEGKKRSNVKFRFQSHAIYDKDTKAEAPFLDAKHLENFSSKFSMTLDSIINTQGLNYVYSTYIDSGALPFALMLEQNGFERFTTETETELLEYSPNKLGSGGKRPRICYKCGKPANHENHTNSKTPGHHLFKVAKYIIYFGDAHDNLIKVKKEEAVHYFTSPNNKYGEEIKVFIGTRATSEGLDFKMIRQIHILQPWYNLSRHEQIIGRGIRSCSHIALPVDERNVTIYQYASIVPKPSLMDRGVEKKLGGKAKVESMSKMETVDLYYYRLAENKDIIIKRILRIMKESAIDCLFFKKQNVILDSSTKSRQKLPDGTVVTVSFADKAYSAMCDYMGNCDYPCNWIPDPKKKYRINEDTYQLHFGKQNIEEAKKQIKNMFHTGFEFMLNEIEAKIRTTAPHIGSIYIYKALDEMVNNPNEIILDVYRRKGYLIYRGNHYIFQPFDYERKDLLMLYRKLPQPTFPSKVDLDEYDYDYPVREMGRAGEAKAEEAKRNEVKVFERTIEQIRVGYRNYAYLVGKRDSPEFRDAVVGHIIDKMVDEPLHAFMRVLLKRIHGIGSGTGKEGQRERKNGLESDEKIIQDIMEYLHYKLIYLYRDVFPTKDPAKRKDPKSIVGYTYDRNYYVLKQMNKIAATGAAGTTGNDGVKMIKSVEIEQASKDLTSKIDKIRDFEERLTKTKSSSSHGIPYNDVYGKIEWNKSHDTKQFVIVDKSSETEGILTKEKKISKRAIIRGMVCKSFGVDRLFALQGKDKLNMPEYPSTMDRGIPNLCATVEIYLRIQNALHKGKKIYFKS